MRVEKWDKANKCGNDHCDAIKLMKLAITMAGSRHKKIYQPKGQQWNTSTNILFIRKRLQQSWYQRAKGLRQIQNRKRLVKSSFKNNFSRYVCPRATSTAKTDVSRHNFPPPIISDNAVLYLHKSDLMKNIFDHFLPAQLLTKKLRNFCPIWITNHKLKVSKANNRNYKNFHSRKKSSEDSRLTQQVPRTNSFRLVR